MDTSVELLSGHNLAALLTLPGIGEKRALDLATAYRTWDAFLAATEDDLADAIGNGPARKLITAGLPTAPLTANLPTGVQVVSKFEPAYPKRLNDVPDQPLLLWWKGTLPNQPGPAPIAVVGTRNPDVFGLGVARLVATEAAQHGHPTCSGLALGVDTAAHEACIAAGQPTWAVLGQGVDTLPLFGDRASLARRILATGGGLISEVPPGTRVVTHLLTKRNRIQSGLSGAVFIAQTGLATKDKPAGTVHTARFAMEQGRYLVVAVPPTALASTPEHAGNVALTNPEGCPPALIHAESSAHRDAIAARRPAADLPLNRAADLTHLWAHLSSQQ